MNEAPQPWVIVILNPAFNPGLRKLSHL